MTNHLTFLYRCQDLKLVPLIKIPVSSRKARKVTKGFELELVPEEGRRIYRPKRCGNNNIDEDNCPKTLNDKSHQASYQKFRQLIFLEFYVLFLVPINIFQEILQIYDVSRTVHGEKYPFNDDFNFGIIKNRRETKLVCYGASSLMWEKKKKFWVGTFSMPVE